MNDELELEDLLNKDYFVIECNNFVFYPKIIRPLGFEMSAYELNIFTDDVDNLTHENRKYPIEQLEQFKSFEEAKKEADRLNNIPKNKKRAMEWNSPEAIYKRNLLMQDILRKSD